MVFLKWQVKFMKLFPLFCSFVTYLFRFDKEILNPFLFGQHEQSKWLCMCVCVRICQQEYLYRDNDAKPRNYRDRLWQISSENKCSELTRIALDYLSPVLCVYILFFLVVWAFRWVYLKGWDIWGKGSWGVFLKIFLFIIKIVFH